MKFLKTLHIFILACLLAACVGPATEVLLTSVPAAPSITEMPAATAMSKATPSMPVATKPISTSFDPSLSVIQVDYSASGDQPNGMILLVDPETGQTAKDKGSFSAQVDPLAANPDQLAAVQGSGQVCESVAYGTACYNEADVLHVFKLTTHQEVTATLPAQGWVNLAVFSPDGTTLALADNQKQGSSLLFFDAQNGSILASQPLSIRPSLIAFRESEKQLVVYGQPLGPDPGVQPPGDPHVLLVGLPDLKIAWDQKLTGILSGSWCESTCDGSFEQRRFANWNPAVVVAPDGNTLYVAHADQDRLTSVDLRTRTVKVTGLQTARSWLDSMLSISTQVAFAKGNQDGANVQAVLSPDGQLLYLLAQSFHSTQGADGNWSTDTSYSGLKIIDVKTGRILNHLETDATQLQISPDGDYLYLMNWASPQPETQVVRIEDLQVVKTLIGWEVTLTRRLNGTLVAMASQVINSTQKEVGILDPQRFSIDHSWKTSSDIQFITIR